jgi:hypothetical protein
MSDRPSDEDIAFRTLVHDTGSALDEAGVHVVRDRDAWERLWSAMTANRSPSADPPAVDWATEMAVVVALGTRMTTGHTVEITGLTRHDGVLRVHAVETRPGAGMLTGQALTHPLHAVATARRDGEARLLIDVTEVTG